MYCVLCTFPPHVVYGKMTISYCSNHCIMDSNTIAQITILLDSIWCYYIMVDTMEMNASKSSCLLKCLDFSSRFMWLLKTT